MSSCDLRSDRRGVGLFVEFMREDIVANSYFEVLGEKASHKKAN